MPLYADLPIGVHPDGFDPVWAPDAFVPGAHGGAPPDFFFAGGQDWAFPPLHPERIRKDGYHYFIGVLRRAFPGSATATRSGGRGFRLYSGKPDRPSPRQAAQATVSAWTR